MARLLSCMIKEKRWGGGFKGGGGMGRILPPPRLFSLDFPNSLNPLNSPLLTLLCQRAAGLQEEAWDEQQQFLARLNLLLRTNSENDKVNARALIVLRLQLINFDSGPSFRK